MSIHLLNSGENICLRTQHFCCYELTRTSICDTCLSSGIKPEETVSTILNGQELLIIIWLTCTSLISVGHQFFALPFQLYLFSSSVQSSSQTAHSTIFTSCILRVRLKTDFHEEVFLTDVHKSFFTFLHEKRNKKEEK